MYVNLYGLKSTYMKYSVKFYPEKRKEIIENVPIMLSVTYSLKRMFFYTGLRCNIDKDPKKSQWDIETSRMKKNQIAPNWQTSTDFNNELTDITKAVNDLFKVYESEKLTPDPDRLRNDLKAKLGKEVKKEQEKDKEGFFDRFNKYMVDAPLSDGRKMHLKTTRIKLEKFKPDTTFKDIDSQYLTDFQNNLLKEHNLSKNTVISELRRLRAFFSWAIKNDWTEKQPFIKFKIGTESFGDPIYITIQERDILYNAIIENESLARVRDIFVFQCLIGARVGDLTKLTKNNIINGCVQYIAGKTKDHEPRVARIPLTEKAKTILARYNEPDGRLLPFISDQKYNEQIKQLFKHDSVKITRIVTILDPKTRQAKQVSIDTIASSHQARRVFVGSLYHKGVKDSIIASMSGHAQDSKAFSRYYKIEQADQQSAISLIE